MGKGVEFVGKVSEAGFPSVVFGSDTKSVGGADGGGTVGTFVGGSRHCNRAARDDVGYDLMSGVTGEDHIWSFGVVREHPTDFFAGAEAYCVAYKGVGISEWVMPVDGTVRYAPFTSKGVVAVRVDDGI